MSDLVERLLAEEDRLDNEAAARITELEAENARLREALNEIARQPLAEAMNDEDLERASFEDGYDYCVRHARAALAGQGDSQKDAPHDCPLSHGTADCDRQPASLSRMERLT